MNKLLGLASTKITKPTLTAISFVAACSLPALAQDRMPGYDILLADLAIKNNLLSISNISAVTNSPANYDNQPLFLPSGNKLLFTSATVRDGKEQTDSYLYNLVTKKSEKLTDTGASEYSPTLMPSQAHFSVIKAFDDQQKFWQYPLTPRDGKPVELLKDLNPVGYHAWVNQHEVILFVLGEPHTLQLANIATQQSQVVDKDIGASLYKIPEQELMSYSLNVGSADKPKWQLNSFDASTGKKQKLTLLPAGSYYYGWSGDGKAIAAQGTKLLQWDPQAAGAGWQQFADVEQTCPQGVSRLTTNSQNTKLAFVCTR